MKSKNETRSPYERAQKKVDAIKGFYGHLVIYLVVCTVLLLARKKIHIVLISEEVFKNTDVLHYIDWNVFGTPIIWGVGLILHAFCVFSFNPFFGKTWEERQIQKYMNEQND